MLRHIEASIRNVLLQYVCIERQKGLTTSHVNEEIELFAWKLEICNAMYEAEQNVEGNYFHLRSLSLSLSLSLPLSKSVVCLM